MKTFRMLLVSLMVAPIFFANLVSAAPQTPAKKAAPLAVTPPKEPAKVIPRIIIDPGHGGKDPGAISSKYKVKEKDLVLSFSKKLAASLKKNMGAKVLLTRNQDNFVELGQRNHFANRNQCDLFLSIHANSAPDNEADGIEIYYLNRASDRASEKLARRENGKMAVKEKREINAILSDLIQAAVTEESSLLAGKVSQSMESRLKSKFQIEDIKVKTALFYVLVGPKCPSLLIETGFITNPKEAKRLKSENFQKYFVEAIAEGVKNYWEQSEKEGGDL